MATLISHNPGQTEALGAEFGRRARRGSVLGLAGDLGAGKTLFVRGVARGLGSPDRVHSPTFALVNIYSGGRLPLYHLDLYRLEDPEKAWNAGIEEFLNPDGVAAVEWIDRWPGPPPADFIRIEFEVLDEFKRRIQYEDPGT